MSGQFQAFPALLPKAGLGGSSRPKRGGYGRLVVTLLCSVLLHVVVIALPYFVMPTRFLIHGGGKAGPFTLSATLIEAAKNGHGPVGSMLNDESAKSPKTKRVASAPETPMPHDTAAEPSLNAPLENVHEDEPHSVEGSFYPTNQLAVIPIPLNEISVGEPEIAFMAAKGKIILILWIDPLGEVLEVSVETDDLPDEIANEMSMAFRQLHFKPGEMDGRTVGAVMKIEVGVD